MNNNSIREQSDKDTNRWHVKGQIFEEHNARAVGTSTTRELGSSI